MSSQRRHARQLGKGGALHVGLDADSMIAVNPGMARRLALIYQSAPQIKRSLAAYRAAGREDPAVLVVDLRDDEGRRLVERLNGVEPGRTMLAESRRLGTIPTSVIVSERRSIAGELSRFAKRISGNIAEIEPPDGTFWGVAVGEGSSSLTPLSFAQVEAAGESDVPITRDDT